MSISFFKLQKKYKSSIYDKLGGRHALINLISEFYKQVCVNEEIAHLFNGIDSCQLQSKIFGFLENGQGRTGEVLDFDFVNAAENLKISDDHFDAVAAELLNTMEEQRFSSNVINEVLEFVGPIRSAVVSTDYENSLRTFMYQAK